MNQTETLLGVLDELRSQVVAGECDTLIVLTAGSDAWRTKCVALYDAANHLNVIDIQRRFADTLDGIRPAAGRQDIRYDL